ncbi:hypothetical protein SERLADRAFT_413673 [Serpula lacrymans var. lacrymans S7.9]|uniref:TrmE-type G domain-containing protein n=1 Tax=Serpula lacrymans var. lacrymans (strain S7.9) TaxID=578457 RepID=F8NPF0_SERL9|nr:uncharacterized protein SERLADRAFT_413673 [Serpula lacrymans var. lacrymans S7.9]EGO27160.1 hypothetical protein SERLADRAFT_413673 [Serpula lacrymans var. lacrymans S7.9]
MCMSKEGAFYPEFLSTRYIPALIRCTAPRSHYSTTHDNPGRVKEKGKEKGEGEEAVGKGKERAKRRGKQKESNQVWNNAEIPQSESQRRTVYALSTPLGKAGVAVVRISGPDALQAWSGMTRPATRRADPTSDRQREPTPWRMERRDIVHPTTKDKLDDGLVVFFKAPSSFTTEDVLELHIHSGRAVISSVLSALAHIPGCRPAEPGEFTRRAFEGGRLDLTQVEGLKDLINAETELQRRMALQNAGGAAKQEFDELRSDILECLVLLEAIVDFSEEFHEGDEEKLFQDTQELARGLCDRISDHLNNPRGEILRSGIRLAIFGPPNVGKSSLLNYLAKREASIVTDVPGTTRDVVELSLDLGGLPVIVADTAGLRKADDLVENIGIGRAQDTVKGSNISLCVLSLPDALVQTPEGPRIQIPPSVAPLITPSTYFLLNKMDMVKSPPDMSGVQAAVEGTRVVGGNSGEDGEGKGEEVGALGNRAWAVSLRTGDGMGTFLEGFTEVLRERYDFSQDQDGSTVPLITHARHRHHLQTAIDHLHAFTSFLHPSTPRTAESKYVDIAAEEVRQAAKAIGKVTGAIDNEDVLDQLFRDFCIGK